MKLKLFTILTIALINLCYAQVPENQELSRTLDSIYEEDQKYRKQISSVMKEHGQNSEEFQELAMTMIKTDASNLLVIEQILDDYGWLGADVVGNKGNQTFFLVIQHADLQTQQKYLPMMEVAVEKGNAKSQNFALLKDRVLIGEGKKQIYGSQLGVNQETGKYFIEPIKDPKHVNKRRQKMGLGPIEDYVSRFGIKWEVQKHIENTEK